MKPSDYGQTWQLKIATPPHTGSLEELLRESIQHVKERKMEGDVVVSKSGATSTKLEEFYHLIPFAAVKAMARRFWIGTVKHAPRNWERGDEEFAEIRLSHCYRHMALFAEFRRQEDLDAVLCNAAMLAYWKERGLLQERE